MTSITNMQELIREFNHRARVSDLQCQVPMDGMFNATTAIIAEAPGDREVMMKVPLVGGSGKMLWDTLRKYNITRRDCYVTNVVKRQLLQSDDSKDKVSKGELQHWQGLLRWELSQLPNLQYVLVLGNLALEAMTGETGITNWRGSVIDVTNARHELALPNCRYVCAFNPAAVLREPKNEPIFKFDMAKFSRVVQGKYKLQNTVALIDPSPREAIAWCDKMQDEQKPIAFDIEIIANETACIGLTNDTHTGMCINFRDTNSNRFSISDEVSVRIRLAQLLSSNQSQLVAQNGNFDSYWLWYKDRIQVSRVWFDTMLAHHTLYPTLPHSLGFLCAQYTSHAYYKDEGKDWREGGDIQQFWEYNVKDICITLDAQRALERELRDQKLEHFFHDHVMHAQRHLVAMTVHGNKCDVALKTKIAEELRGDVDKLLSEFHQRIHEATGDSEYSPNPASPKQMQELYFRKLHLVGRGTSCDATNRRRMRDHRGTTEPAKAVIDAQNIWAKEAKFLSTYAEMVIDDDGRIRCEYKQTGVQSAPGRLSSSAVMWGSGMNLQNQPPRAYPMFITDEGYEFNYFDLSQAEARVVAHLAGIQSWIDDFALADAGTGYDTHRSTAAKIFGVPYDEIPVEDRDDEGRITKRYLGKRCKHGLNYRMASDKLAETCNIPLHQAEDAYYAYHRAFPEVKQWWDDTIREVRATRELFSPMGRRLAILHDIYKDDAALDSIVAFKPQSTIGDKVVQVIYQCHEDPEWPEDARIALNIHDALIAINRIEVGDTVRRIMKKHAEAPILINGTPVVIPCELKVSYPDEQGIHRWSTLGKLKKGSQYVQLSLW